VVGAGAVVDGVNHLEEEHEEFEGASCGREDLRTGEGWSVEGKWPE
jgi:hypothetical protein